MIPMGGLGGATGFLLVLVSACSADGPKQQPDEPPVVSVAWTRQGAYVTSIAFAPNGQMLAMGSTDGTVYLCDVATGNETLRISGDARKSIRQGVAFSPDGKTLAAGTPDDRICLWELPSGKAGLYVEGDRRCQISAVVFSSDGKTVAAPGPELTPHMWDAHTGKLVGRFEPAQGAVYSVALSLDGKFLASGCAGGALCVWDVATGKIIHKLEQHGGANSVAFSPDGKLLAAGSGSHRLFLWDMTTGKLLRELSRHGNQVHAVAFSPDSKFLASGCEDGKVRLFEVVTGRELALLNPKQRCVYSIAFSPDGRLLASGGLDPADSAALAQAVGSGRVWDLSGWFKGIAESVVCLSAEDLQRLWGDLGTDQDQKAFRAILTLSTTPQQTVHFLDERLQPAEIPAATVERVAQAIADLGHGQKAERDRALAELEELSLAVEPALRRALAGTPSREARKQLEWLLGELRGLDPTPEMRLARRATEVLERIGTPEARQLLERLANGALDAWLTREAKATLERLAKRSDSLHSSGVRR